MFATLAEPEADAAAALRERVRKLLQSLLEAIMAAMDGRQCRQENAAAPPLQSGAAEPSAARQEYSWRSTVVERICESETTTVCGSGSVRTEDGRSIGFDFSVDMQYRRERLSVFQSEGSVLLRDPLVLSYPGQTCELAGERIRFDLDRDGRCESLPGLASGNGFLVFDRNGNGRADDGSELFGAVSGDGFAELALLDGDGSGWIDEGDAVWSQLALWSGDSFQSLATAGIGALHVGSVAAPFSLRDENGGLLGQIRAAGFYLRENGAAGLVQQVDLASSAPPAGK